jgi:hypothetical protein
MTALVQFADGSSTYVYDADVSHLKPGPMQAYQVAVNLGRSKRKGQPYENGSTERDEDGFYWSAENATLLTYASSLLLEVGDKVLVPLGNHYSPREAIVIARSSDYTGDLKEIYGLAKPGRPFFTHANALAGLLG